MINLLHGDCLELMKSIPDKSIDMILTDPPYGTTACKWDVVIPFEPMWIELKRVIKDNGAICLFGSEPFSSHLRLSNLKMFKYDLVWDKMRSGAIGVAKYRPMPSFENIMVFGKSKTTYNPQMRIGKAYIDKRGDDTVIENLYENAHKYGFNSKKSQHNEGVRYPLSILPFVKFNTKGNHPTQKPVPLLEYLIKTYTLENETVLDFTMGSGSTGVACINLNRNFIGIEKDDKYFEIGSKRIKDCLDSKTEIARERIGV